MWLCLATIYAVVNSCARSLVDDLVKGCQAADNNVGQIFKEG